MFFNFALFATLACHSFALPNHIKRQELTVNVYQQWMDIVKFVDSEENPATNANYTCTDRCAIWNDAVNSTTPPTPSFCTHSNQQDILNCTECVGSYFMTRLAQPNPLGNLVLIHKFLLEQVNCTVFQTTSTPHATEPAASISSSSGIQTGPTSDTDAPSSSSSNTALIQSESGVSPPPTDGDTTYGSSETETGMPGSATEATSNTTPDAISSSSGSLASPTSDTDAPSSSSSNTALIQSESGVSPPPTDGDTTYGSSETETGIPNSATEATSNTTPDAISSSSGSQTSPTSITDASSSSSSSSSISSPSPSLVFTQTVDLRPPVPGEGSPTGY